MITGSPDLSTINMKPTCGIIIATHNRLGDLQRTLGALGQLQPPPDEIVVCADACTDGTAQWVREFQPACRLMVNETSRGSIGSRDAMMRLAQSEIILSLDDDSHPIEPDFIGRLRELFARNPRLAVAGFPQRSDEFPESLTAKDFGQPHFTGSYSSSGAAIRRNVFLELGGYPVQFHHAYEEPDFALRCASAGWQVRCETSLHIRHHYSGAQRNELRTHHFHARNELWSVMMRCPAPYCIAVGAFRFFRQFGYAAERGPAWLLREPAWWLDFFAGLPACFSRRTPVPWSLYRNWMRLLRHPIFSETEWTQKFTTQTKNS